MSCQGHSLDLGSNNIPNFSWTEAFPQKCWARKLARFRAQFASTKSGLWCVHYRVLSPLGPKAVTKGRFPVPI